ncbi:MAG: GDP-mannose 4,6-dehydratase, partial [Clostridia bacterium]|nr:GDP-mannose 4,6-dehydratase [Clostridia bacterium]
QVLLDAARNCWITKAGTKEGRRFIQVSTDEVYGTLGSEGFFTEETPPDPRSPYSASKASADMLVKAYYHTYGLPVNITRCSNNYGPCQFPEKLIPLMINNALCHRGLPVYGDGRQVRDWLYVRDHSRAIDLVACKAKPGETYNIGGHNEKKNIEMVRTIIKTLRTMTKDDTISEELIKHVTDRPGHDRRYAIDPGKITGELGWLPETSFEEGIEVTVSWYMDNRNWLENVTSGEYRDYYRRMYGGQTP